MTTPLESQYRRLLRWYPRSWRAQHGEAFIGTLLDVADSQGRVSPRFDERRSILAHGLESRMDRVIVPSVRQAGSTIALTAGAGIALAEFVMTSWAPWATETPSPGWLQRTGPFYDIGFVFAALWLFALVAGLAGKWALGRLALIVSLVAGVVSPPLVESVPGALGIDPATMTLLSCFALGALLGRPRPGLPTAGATAGWMLLVVLAYAGPTGRVLDWSSSEVLWRQVGTLWYAAAVIILVALALAIARLWWAAFTIVLGLAPVAATFVISEVRGLLLESGSSVVIAVPVGVGLVLLVLSSSGRLTLPSTRPRLPSTFGAAAAVVLVAGVAFSATSFHFDHAATAPSTATRIDSPVVGPFSVSSPVPEEGAPGSFEELDGDTATRATAVVMDASSGRVTSLVFSSRPGTPAR